MYLRLGALLPLIALLLTAQVQAQAVAVERAPAPETRVLAARSLTGPRAAVGVGIGLFSLVGPGTLILGAVANAGDDGEEKGLKPGVIGMAATAMVGGVILLIWGAKRIHDIRAARDQVARFEGAGLTLTSGGAHLGARLRF